MEAKSLRSIALSIAEEHRSPAEIGSDIEYAHVTRGVRTLLALVVILVAVLIALSLFVKVEEVARARGEFVPVQRVQVIQSPEGGAIEEVAVRNDQHVEKGQLIARFRAANLVRDMAQADVRMAYLQIAIERLDAFATGRTPQFDSYREKYAAMVGEAESLNAQQVRAFDSDIEQVNRQIDEEAAALLAAQREIPSTTTSLRATRALLQRTRDGAEKGIIPMNRVAQVEEQAAQSERVYTQTVSSLDQHQARIKSLEAQRNAVTAKAAADARNQRADLLVQLNELKAAQEANESRSVDVQVRAPIAGIVQKISETPIGTVIPAGGTVCEIVPTEGGVLMQAHVSPRDIGFVQINQGVVVKSDAFDYGRFGSVGAKVVRIAPSSRTDGPGQASYFLVEIELDQPHVGTDKQHVVTPGMTGEASILTGEKTVFQYLLKPIYLTLDTALRER